MNVSTVELKRLIRFISSVQKRSINIHSTVSRGDVMQALDMLMEIHIEAAKMKARLGLSDLTDDDRPISMPDVPIDLLTSPANRRLAHLLRETWEAAIDVDKERGWFPDGQADFIEDILVHVEQEVYGPEGHDERSLGA